MGVVIPEPIYLSLRERLRATNAERVDSHPLVRLGALYHLAERASLASEQELIDIRLRLSQCIDEAEVVGAIDSNVEAAEFSVHAAFNLAQLDDYAGIKWLLRLFHGPHPEIRALATTALRSCWRFPLASPITEVYDLQFPGIPADRLDRLDASLCSLLSHTADEFAGRDDGQVREDSSRPLFQRLTDETNLLSDAPRTSNLDLAIGTIITRPWSNLPVGFKRTAFVVIEQPVGVLQAVSFDGATIANLGRGPGRFQTPQLIRAVVTYGEPDSGEARFVYGLPLEPLSEAEARALLIRLYEDSEGSELYIVADIGPNGYLMLSSAGKSQRSNFRTEERFLGECFLGHKDNQYPLPTRLGVASGLLDDIVRKFIERTEQDMAIQVGREGSLRRMVSRDGQALTVRYDGSEQPVYMCEHNLHRPYVWSLPGDPWRVEDRLRVVSQYFERRLESFGIVLDVSGTPSGARRARVVRYREPAATRSLSVEDAVIAGNVVVWFPVAGGGIDPLVVVDFETSGACLTCLGAGVSLCQSCSGSGQMTCPSCAGNRSSECDRCDGSGENFYECEECSGTGVCKGCSGSSLVTLPCSICEGLGHYSDSGRQCKRCGGAGSFEVGCRRCSGGRDLAGKCRRCRGEGGRTVSCQACSGTGIAACKACRQSGLVACDSCEGQRLVLCHCDGQQRGEIVHSQRVNTGE